MTGRRFDPREAENELSRMVLLSTAEEIRYSYDPDSDGPNSVVIILRVINRNGDKAATVGLLRGGRRQRTVEPV